MRPSASDAAPPLPSDPMPPTRLPADPDASAAAAVHDLRVALERTEERVVDGVSLELRAGEILGLVGESGSGKTTVGMALLGYCRPGARVTGGDVAIEGRTVAFGAGERNDGIRGSRVTYVPQDPPSALNPARRLSRQLGEVFDAHAPDWPPERRAARLAEVLDEVGLPGDPEFLRRYPHQLSGGQQQRVVLAMAFVVRPRVVVCDEPTTGLDVTTQARVLDTIRSLCRGHGTAALYVSHDLAVVASLADRVAVMYAGRIVEQGAVADVFHRPRHPYTRRLLAAVPDPRGRRPPLGIPGRTPLVGGRETTACAFAPRCALALETCRTVPPPLVELEAGHTVLCHRAAERETLAAGVADARVASTAALLLAASAIEASYGGHAVVHGVDVDVRAGECVAVVGESGSGKTTLARCIAGLHAEYHGEVRLGERALAHSARRRERDVRRAIQYVFQNPYASLNPRLTVGDSIAVPLRLFFGLSWSDVARRVEQLLETVALPAAIAERLPSRLSGGERQRVAIARALAANPSLLVCDEITSALDVSVQAALIELLEQLRAEIGLSILFITHNLPLVRTIADRVMVMSAGRMVESGTVERVFEAPASDYTRRLLADTPTIEAV